MDNDSEVLEDAAEAVLEIDLRYREADFQGKKRLKKRRDEAFRAYTRARLKLLADGTLCANEDVREMTGLRREIERAAGTQALLASSARLIAFLARF